MIHPTPGRDDLGGLLRRAACDEVPRARTRARAFALGGTARRLTKQTSALWRRLVATPIAVGGAGFAPAFGVRGAAGPTHRLLRAEECEIDLRVCGRGEGWTIAGQLFAAPGARQVLLAGPHVEAVVQLGETSEFTFTSLPAGRYTLTVKMPELDIVVPEFEVGPASVDEAGLRPAPDDRSAV